LDQSARRKLEREEEMNVGGEEEEEEAGRAVGELET